RSLQLLDWNDRIATGGQNRAGHHFDAVAVRLERERGASCRLDAGEAETAARKVTRAERDAVHCHAIEGGCVAFREKGLPEDAAGAGRERGELLRHRRDGGVDCRIGFGGRQHGEPRRRQFCLSRALKIRSCSLKRSAIAWTSSTAALFFFACMARSSVRRFSSYWPLFSNVVISRSRQAL